MSVEINVLFHGTLPAKAALTRAMKELGFPLTILPPAGSLEKQSGFMPMRFRREETGVEFGVFTGRADIEDLAGFTGDIDPRFDRSANFRFGGDENEMVCGACAAAALARLVNGVVLGDGKPLTVDEAIAWAAKHLRDATPPDKRGGTRPADIKRYLKALLKERSDLALVGRLLVIKPVRHILRGVLFDRTGRGSRFRIWRYVLDLCHAGDGSSVGYGDYFFGPRWDVWQPHFEPALMDALAEDVFDRVGKITTFDDLAAELSDTNQLYDARITALLLAGERDRALEYLRQIESRDPSYWGQWAEARREFLTQDFHAVCAAFHDREARAAKALKIEHIWEPSPFPVELPAAERAKSAEPPFIPKPWIARPPGLLQELPEQVGDVGYAKDRLRRQGRTILVASLSPDEAEDRHRNSEPYFLAKRLSERLALLLHRDGEDRDDPSRHPGYASLGGLALELHGSAFVAEATFQQADSHKKTLAFWSMHVLERSTQESVWSWRFDRWDEEEIRDDRAERLTTKGKLTDADIAQLTCPKPAFGEFDAPVTMMLTVLRTRGFGEFT
jgi:hypothetical protein